MHTSIKNPIKHAKRKAARSLRRVRPSYPVAHGTMRLDRPECGVNRELLTAEKIKKGVEPTMLLGQFLFFRTRPRPSRSKYAPHVGIKQDARILKTLGLVA